MAIEDPLCGETLYSVDFGSVQEAGKYYLEGAGEKSDTFAVGRDVLAGVHNAMIKALYYQRCGCALEEKYAGAYVHAACHMADSEVYGESGHMLKAQGGWHDAGDYGRYITPGAVAVAHLLYAYKLYPQAFAEGLNIPESGNGVADVLNECRYELEWMLETAAAGWRRISQADSLEPCSVYHAGGRCRPVLCLCGVLSGRGGFLRMHGACRQSI